MLLGSRVEGSEFREPIRRRFFLRLVFRFGRFQRLVGNFARFFALRLGGPVDFEGGPIQADGDDSPTTRIDGGQRASAGPRDGVP